MPPLLSQLRTLLWYMFSLTIAGVMFAWILVATHSAQWRGALLFALPGFQLLGFIVASAYYVSRSLPFSQRKFLRVLITYCSSSLLSSLVWLTLCVFWNSLIKSVGVSWAGVDLSLLLLTLLLGVGSVFYLMSLLAHDVLFAFENIREGEHRQAATLLLARDAELHVLRSQINPHFLFNSLNSISALTSLDAAAARAMTIELGSFFRKTLAVSDRKYIALSEEINLCEHFLAIEKIRFGKKLQYNIEIDPVALAAKVPPMLLQPLIENSLKHGICNLIDGGMITMNIATHHTQLCISISNPVDHSSSDAQGTGTGLKNLKARTDNLYGEKAHIHWKTENDIFCVEIITPLEFL
jgi:two-component system, LytTR family, sensor histidine kinase AlgZ